MTRLAFCSVFLFAYYYSMFTSVGLSYLVVQCTAEQPTIQCTLYHRYKRRRLYCFVTRRCCIVLIEEILSSLVLHYNCSQNQSCALLRPSVAAPASLLWSPLAIDAVAAADAPFRHLNSWADYSAIAACSRRSYVTVPLWRPANPANRLYHELRKPRIFSSHQ
jgi:hypothetical protein